MLREIDCHLWADDPSFACQFTGHGRSSDRPVGGPPRRPAQADELADDADRSRLWLHGVFTVVGFAAAASVVVMLLVLGPGHIRGCPDTAGAQPAKSSSAVALDARTAGAPPARCPGAAPARGDSQVGRRDGQ